MTLQERLEAIAKRLKIKMRTGSYEDHIDSIVLALQEAYSLDREEWIDIDSSPKDGRHVLIYDPNTEEIYKAWWNQYMGNGCWNYDGHQYIPNPTHWQPLPHTPVNK